MSRLKNYDPLTQQWVKSDKSGLPANVFPTFDDLRVNNGTELQIKASATGKTLGQCELGETVYLPETINGVKDFHEYIVVEKNGEDNVVLLRKYVTNGDSGAISQDVNVYVHGSYYATGNTTHYADNWCTTTFYNRFSDITKEYISQKVIKIITNENGGTGNFTRKVFLPSIDELGGTPNIGSGEGTNVWFTSNADRVALSETDKTTAVQYWTRTLHAFTISSHNHYVFDYVTTSGAFSTQNYTGTTSKPYRPAIVFLPTTPLNGSNQFVDEITYINTIEKIRSGDDLYKLKDLDAREAITTLETAVAGKAAASHTHTVSDITDFPSIPTAGTITSGSTGYATGGDVYNAINKSPYDLAFLAEADSLIDSRTSGATVTNAHLTALVPLDDLLLKSDRYDRVELCGGFHYTDPTLGFLIVVPATLSYNAIIPNQVAQQMLPTIDPDATINSKDALLVRITPVYNDDAYQASFVIWEDENDVRQIEYVGT